MRSFASDEPPKRPEAGQYFAEDWLQPPAALPARPGHNRFVWDLRGPRPRALEYEYSIAAVPGADTPELPQGLFVAAGNLPGPPDGRTARTTTPAAHRGAWTRGSRRRTPTSWPSTRCTPRSRRALARVTAAQERVQAIADRLKALEASSPTAPDSGRPGDARAAQRVPADLAPLPGAPGPAGERGETTTSPPSPASSPRSPPTSKAADRAPTGPQREVFELYGKRLDSALAKWQALAERRDPRPRPPGSARPGWRRSRGSGAETTDPRRHRGDPAMPDSAFRTSAVERFLRYVTFDTQSSETSRDLPQHGQAARPAAPPGRRAEGDRPRRRRDRRARLRDGDHPGHHQEDRACR